MEQEPRSGQRVTLPDVEIFHNHLFLFYHENPRGQVRRAQTDWLSFGKICYTSIDVSSPL